MKFVVDRSKWVNGSNMESGEFLIDKYGEDHAPPSKTNSTSMLNSLGNMCCLGHCALQLGWKPEHLLHKMTPSTLVHKAKAAGMKIKRRGIFVHKNTGSLTDLACGAIELNDSSVISDAHREIALKRLFKHHGHSITFTGEQCT